jgi:RNA polymerase sigma-70 factor (ECF subfamily)
MEPDRTDCKLVLRLRNGDADALDVVLKLHWATLLDYLTALGVCSDTAEDVAQQTFVRLWERRETLRLEGSLRGLLCRIARNLCFDLMRRRKSRDRAAFRSVETLTPASTPHDSLVGGELREILEAAVNALPKRRREVFVLVRIHGLSHRETAKVLDLAPQTVANHLGLALADLRISLARYLPDYYRSSENVKEYAQPNRMALGLGG